MAPKIHRLPALLINQIAAGEVVEHAASVVKELVENSLDASAKRIDISAALEEKGALVVEDDGWGMGREDALLCIERHATSKIRSFEDFAAVTTMGFRGEALAAIASVCRFELKTSTGEEEGTHLVVEGGEIVSLDPCTRNRGTSVSVSALFEKVPARKKFQKSPSAQKSQLVRTVEALSLAHPEVAFSLRISGRSLLAVEPQSRRGRVEAVLGPFPEEVATGGLWGLLAAPEQATLQRKEQFFFVNRRSVFSPLVAKAVQSGYGMRLQAGLFPPFVLFLSLPPEEVDVNVHPQKKEVRFRDEGKLFREVESAVATAFSAPSFVEPLTFAAPPPTQEASFFFFEEPQEKMALPLSIPEVPLCVFRHYLLLQGQQLLLIDLQRALARIFFEALSAPGGSLQPLLWPLEIEAEEEALLELAELGIEARLVGKKKIALEAIPSHIEPAEFPHFFALWREEKKLPQAARRFFVARSKGYLLDEALCIWKELQRCCEKRVDPVGGPIWRPIDEKDLRRVLDESFAPSKTAAMDA